MKTKRYLVEPAKRRNKYTFNPLALHPGEGRFSHAYKLVKDALDAEARKLGGKEVETIASSPQGAASKIGYRCGVKPDKMGVFIDSVLDFAVYRDGNEMYTPGFMAKNAYGMKPVEMTEWLTEFYVRRDLGLPNYSRRKPDIKRGLAERFCDTHIFEEILDREPALADVKAVMKMLDANRTLPTRAELKAALASTLTHPDLYTNSEIANKWKQAEAENLRLGTEDAQREYADAVITECMPRPYAQGMLFNIVKTEV